MAGTDQAEKADWRKKAKPIKEGSTYPAKEFCSHCGLCDTYYVAHVKDACAFLGDGAMSCRPLKPGCWCTLRDKGSAFLAMSKG